MVGDLAQALYRSESEAAAEARDLVAGRIEGTFAPPPSAIAHHLIKTWSEG